MQPLIYAIVENGAFASDVLLPSLARVTHIWNVLPGSHPNPWIGCLLRRLRTQCLVRENGAGFYSDLSYQREGYHALFPDLEGSPEDLPDAAAWQPLASWEGEVDSTGIEVHVRTATRLEIERETLEYLWEASAIDPQLQARADISTHRLSCTITGLDLYARRKEAAEAITADIVFALGDTGLNEHIRETGPVDLLYWTDNGHSQYCACGAPFYRHGEWCSRRIFWSAWNPDGRIFLILDRPARKPIEQEFLLLLAAIEALQRCARTAP